MLIREGSTWVRVELEVGVDYIIQPRNLSFILEIMTASEQPQPSDIGVALKDSQCASIRLGALDSLWVRSLYDDCDLCFVKGVTL